MPQFAPASITRKPLLQAESKASATRILVTGATGYIGNSNSMPLGTWAVPSVLLIRVQVCEVHP